MDLDPRLHFVAVTAIIVKDEKFLIAQRAPNEKVFPLKWTVPGGKVVFSDYKNLPRGYGGHNNTNDARSAEGGVGRKVQGSSRVGDYSEPRVLKEERSDEQWYNVIEWVLRKEVREEVGLEIEKPKYVTDLVFVRPDGYPVVTLSYWAPYKSGEVVLNHELVRHAWVTLEEAKKYDLIEGIWEELKEVEEIISR